MRGNFSRKKERERELEKGNWILGFCENIETRSSKLRAVRGRESRDPSREKRGESPLLSPVLRYPLVKIGGYGSNSRIKLNGGIAARSERKMLWQMLRYRERVSRF